MEENLFGTRNVFWDQLKNFWPVEKVASWEAELFSVGLSATGMERIKNLMTLSTDAHGQWNRGAFALKPTSVSDSKIILRMQFFWQKRHEGVDATMSFLPIPVSTENLDSNLGAFRRSISLARGREWIKSGDYFDLTTDDAVEKPLPSFNLLDLQWFLTRVVGMAGAAFSYDAIYGDDSDEDIPDL